MGGIEAIVETAIYVDDLEAAEAFYRGVLGLEVIGKVPGRHVCFRVGNSVLLAFNPDATLRGDLLRPHRSRGPGDFALGVRAEDLGEWRQRLESHGVAVEKGVAWPRGGRSLYFRDPAGNSVELVTPGLWGLRSEWQWAETAIRTDPGLGGIVGIVAEGRFRLVDAKHTPLAMDEGGTR